MEPINYLGFFAGACLLSSMLVKDIYKVKILLLVGSISWLSYGSVLHLLPIIIINVIITSSGIYTVTRMTRQKLHDKKSVG